MSLVHADGITDVQVNKHDNQLDISAYTAEGDPFYIASIQYNMDGAGWVSLPASDGTYDTWSESATLLASALPYGSHDIEIKAVDSDGGEMAGPTQTLDNIQSIITVTPNNTGTEIVTSAESNDGLLTISAIDYKLDGGSWNHLPADDGSYGGTTESATLLASAIPSGSHTIDIRAVDNNSTVWPAAAPETLENTDTITVTPSDNGDTVGIDAASANCTLKVNNIEYRVDGGSWDSLPADDGTYGDSACHETATLNKSSVPTGTHDVDIRAIDQFTDNWPKPTGYTTISVDGTAVSDGQDADHLASFTGGGRTLSFQTNSDGTWVYMITTINFLTDYSVETYQTGSATDTYLEYYGHDSTFSTLVSSDDNSGDGNYSKINFTPDAVGTYYFRARNVDPPSTDTFGIYSKPVNNEIENAITTTTSGVGELTIPTKITGTNRFLAVQVSYRSNDYWISGMDLNSALTFGCRANSNEYKSEIWYINNPTIGQSNLQITFDGSNSVEDIVANAVLFKGVDNNNPVGDTSCDQAPADPWSSTPSATMDTSAGQIVFGGATTYESLNTLTKDAGLTEVWNKTSNNVIGAGAYKLAEGASTTVSWTGLVSWPWATSGIAINKAGPPVAGTSADNPAEITTGGNVYNLDTNSDGTWVYLYADVPGAGDYYTETYQSGSATDTYLEYYGTDSTFSTRVSANDNYNDNYSHINFTATGAGNVYFRVKNANGISSDSFGVRYNTYTPACSLPIYSQGFEYSHVIGSVWNESSASLNGFVGSEWALSLTPNYGRATINTGAYANTGNGGFTMESTGNTLTSNSMTLSLDMSAYQKMDDITLNLDYLWKDSHSDVYDGLNIFIKESSSQSAEHVATINNRGNIGSYHSSSVYLTPSLRIKPTSTFQIIFQWQGRKATSSEESFTLDNVQVVTGLAASCTSASPTINFIDEPGAHEGGRIVVAGTAVSADARISLVDGSMTNNSITTSAIIVTDGALTTASEDFTAAFAPTATGAYSISITVTDTLGQTHTYNYSGTVDDIDVPQIDVSNFGLLPTADNTPTYTGEAVDASSNITGVFYRVYNVDLAEYETDWTLATSTGDGFNSQDEGFTFTTPTLPDGVTYIIVEAVDQFGNYNYDTGDFIGNIVDRITVDAVDTSAPIIQVQDIIPNPTEDAEPVLQGKVRDDETEKSSLISHLWYKVDGGEWTTMNSYDGTIDSIEEMFSVRLTGLTLGAHTVTVRASDTAGNDTNTQSKNQSITFTIVAPGTYNSTEITKTETFDTHADQDLIDTNLIWGNGELRLPEEMTITPHVLSASGYGPRYGGFNGGMRISPSHANGFWVTKDQGKFAFYSFGSSTETDFDIADYSPWGTVPVGQILEYYVGGQYHVWIASYYGVIGINFGASITDGLNDVSTSYETGNTGTTLIQIDERGGSNYGIFMNTTGDGIHYFKPHDFSTALDDESMVFNGAAGYSVNNTTALYLEPDSNRLWIGAYYAGTTVLDDNGTPLYATDDVKLVHSEIGGVFDFGRDKNGKVFFGGDDGLQILTNDGGTFQNANDDTIVTLATVADLGANVINRVVYNAGQSPVGAGFYIGTRSGNIKFLGTNDTYADPLDDQIINLPATGDFYPSIADDFYQIDDTHLLSVNERQGVVLLDITRQYAASGSALSQVDVQIQGRPDADFITLDSVDVILQAGGLSYEVSNDGGLTWYPITVGETVRFPTRDHRIKFRINMTRGSTPVVGGYQLSYAAYASTNRVLSLGVADEPAEVDSGAPFGFKVLALDELYNPYDPDMVVNLQLRKVSDNSVADSFNVPSALVHDGVTSITDAAANVLGYYYIYASSGSATAASNPILFKGNSNQVVPSLSFTADKYLVKAGSKVTLSWSSSNLSSLVLSNQDVNYGFVNSSGTREVTIDKDTTFTLAGSGIYGSLTRTLTIRVEGEPVTEPPVINVFDVVSTPGEDKDKVLVTWDVAGADSVDITNVGTNLPPKGSAEVFVTKDTDFVLTAHNAYGDVTQTKSVDFSGLKNLPSTSQRNSTLLSIVPLLLSSVLTLMSAIFLSSGGIGSLFESLVSKFGVLFGIIIPRKRKYWGIVYDVRKNKGLPFAPVRLYLGAELVAQTVSDLNGKYGLLIDKAGTYTLKVESSGFEDFSKKISVSAAGGGYEIIEDIPMVRLDQKYNKLYRFMFYSRQEIISGLKATLLILMFVGFGYSLYVTYNYPVLVNFIILAVYTVLFILNLFSVLHFRRASGKVLDKGSKEPVAGASIRIYENGTQLGVYLTNSKGVVKMNIKAGNYWALVNKAGYEMVGKEGEQIVVMPGGYISKDILLKKSAVKRTMATLAEVEELKVYKNPFS